MNPVAFFYRLRPCAAFLTCIDEEPGRRAFTDIKHPDLNRLATGLFVVSFGMLSFHSGDVTQTNTRFGWRSARAR